MIENPKIKEDEERWEEAGRPKLVFDEHVLEFPISRLGLRPAVQVPEGTSVAEAIRSMRERRIGSVMVTRDGLLCGILTERDLLMRAALGELDPNTTKVEALMHPNPEALSPEEPIAYALHMMSLGGYRRVPLVDAKGRPVGIVSVRDIVDYLAEFFKDKVINLPPTPQGTIPPKREGG